MQCFDVAILAAGRLRGDAAEEGALKASISVADTTMLDATVNAFRASTIAQRIIVVAPHALFSSQSAVDVWIEEGATGEDNVISALANARTQRVILSASDMPFIHTAHIENFVSLVPDDVDFAYPIFRREEFLDAFPGGRTAFAPVGGRQWTGGSLVLINVELARKHTRLIRRGFAARKNLLALSQVLGPHVVLRFLTGTLQMHHIEHRVARLTGGKAVAITGAHPALAMDCDSSADVAYVRARQ